MPEKIIVIFHKDCPDGFGSYWVARKKFGERARYWAALYGDPPPAVDKDTTLYMLDFSFKRPVMETLCKNANKVIVIDHHKSAYQDTLGLDKELDNLELNFDMEHSGCVLSWKYFFPKKPTPMFLEFIEDRDIWTWKMKDSGLFLASLDSYGYTLDLFDRAAKSPQSFIKEGEPILRFKRNIVDRCIENSNFVIFKGERFIAINLSNKEFVSDTGNRLCSYFKTPALVWHFDHSEQRTEISLRSNDEIDFDVSAFAVKHGGGGHRNASGMRHDGMIQFDELIETPPGMIKA